MFGRNRHASLFMVGVTVLRFSSFGSESASATAGWRGPPVAFMEVADQSLAEVAFAEDAIQVSRTG
jgi:hypothetical protein